MFQCSINTKVILKHMGKLSMMNEVASLVSFNDGLNVPKYLRRETI